MIFTGAKQRVFEESPNLRKTRVIRSMFLHSKYYKQYSQNKYLLSNRRNRNKNLWENKRFLFRRENKKLFSRGNKFFEGFYLYRLKRFINFFKFFLYNRHSNNFNSVVYKDFNRILVEYNRFFNKKTNLSFFGNLFQSNFNLSYNFSYIKKEKLKLRTIYNIKKYKSFIKKIQNFFSSSNSDYNRLLINYLEFSLYMLVYRAKFVNSIYSSEQLIKHGFFEVDGKIIKKPSFHLSLNESVQLVPTYTVYLKKQKLGYLLQSFLAWYSGYFFWFNKKSNYLDSFFSLLLFKYLVNHKKGLDFFNYKTSFGDKFNTFNNDSIRAVVVKNSDLLEQSVEKSVLNLNFFINEVFNLIEPNLRLFYRSVIKNYLVLNNKFFYLKGPIYLKNTFFMLSFKNFMPLFVNIFNGVKWEKKHKKPFITFKERKIIRRILLKKSSKRIAFSNIFKRNKFKFSLYLKVNKRNFGFNSYAVKFNKFNLNFTVSKKKKLNEYFDSLNEMKKFLVDYSIEDKRLDFFGLDISLEKKLFNLKKIYFISKENAFISKYYLLLKNFFIDSNVFYTVNFNKIINVLLDKNFIVNVLFNHKNNYKSSRLFNVTDSFSLKLTNKFNFFSKNFTTKSSSFVCIDNIFSNDLGFLNRYYIILQKYLNHTNILYLYNNKIFKSINKIKKSFLVKKDFLTINTFKSINVSNSNYGFSVALDLFDWLKLRNLNLKFKKFILYYFYLENINLLKDFGSYKKRNKSIIFEYKIKFYSSNSYFIDKFYIVFLKNSEGKVNFFFYPKVFSTRYHYKNKYINLYNNLFVNYKKQLLHNYLKQTNNNSLILNYYTFYKEFKFFKNKFNLILKLDSVKNHYLNNDFIARKLYILFFELVSLMLKSGVLVEEKFLFNEILKILLYFKNVFGFFHLKNEDLCLGTVLKKDYCMGNSKVFFSINSKTDFISYDLFIQLKNFPKLMHNLVKVLNIVPSYIEIDYELNSVVISYFPFVEEVPFINLVDIKSLSNVFKSTSRY